MLAEDPVPHAHRVLALDTPLAHAARQAGVDADPRPRAHSGHARAQGGDLPGDVAARPERQRRLEGREPAEDPEVESVQPAGAHADQHLARARARRRDLLDADTLGSAELAEDGCLHWTDSSL